MSSNFAHNLAAIRTYRKLTQEDVSQLLNPPVKQATISHYESGKREPCNLNRLQELARVLQVPVDALISAEPWQAPTDGQEAAHA